MPKLNQILAIEKGIKSRTQSALTELYKAAQKPALFNGLSKTYRPLAEDGEQYPPENQRVQMRVNDVLFDAADNLTEYLDITLTKDNANLQAVADVDLGINGTLKGMPVTFLLALEKSLTDLHTFISKLPVLDETENWTLDDNSGLHKTAVVSTQRPKKVQKPIVLYQATKEHPAQTQLITEDVLVGYWDTVKYSGALPAPRKALLLDRVEKLQQAVKIAREQANMVEAPEQKIGQAIFDYLLAD